MTNTPKTIKAAGATFETWADFVKRGIFAKNVETGEVKQICGSYIKNELTIRKAIAAAFNLSTFRKENHTK